MRPCFGHDLVPPPFGTSITISCDNRPAQIRPRYESGVWRCFGHTGSPQLPRGACKDAQIRTQRQSELLLLRAAQYHSIMPPNVSFFNAISAGDDAREWLVTREIGDDCWHAGVETHNVQHIHVIRDSDREAVAGKRDHDKLRTDAHGVTILL